MTPDYTGYLTLLRELTKTLSQLTEIAHAKTAAVRKDDLVSLDQCIKQEQALSLSLRGYEQKRMASLSALGLQGVPLSGLATQYPNSLQREAKATAEELLRQYQLYCSASEVARSTLECNLHEIEKILVDLGESPRSESGYQKPSPTPPPAMKTDFRA